MPEPGQMLFEALWPGIKWSNKPPQMQETYTAAEAKIRAPLVSALERIARNEKEEWDDDLKEVVFVSYDAEEMADIARAALDQHPNGD